MADLEFEELAAGNVMRSLEQIPQHFRAPAKCYTLAHDMDVDDDDVPVQMGKSRPFRRMSPTFWRRG